MAPELWVFLTMVGVFAAGCFAAKLPVSVSMVLASVAGALVGGQGIPIRHLVEGTFGYVDTILTIATAMIFMNAVRETGALDALASAIIRRFNRIPGLLLVLLMLVAMFPGMITGSSTASVLTAGAVIAPVLALLGLPATEAGAFISMAGILGMIAPPVNIPAMIIGGGIDMPYVGFEVPLLLLTIPVAIFSALFYGYRYARKMDRAAVLASLEARGYVKAGFAVYIPIILVVVLMVADKALPEIVNLGMPLTFVIGTAATLFVGKKFKLLDTAKAAMDQAMPVLGILVGVGMFIQIMTLTGVRGFIVVNALSVPPLLLYAAIAITIPLFGAVSAFGASSVLGVPFLLALLQKDQIVTAASLSFIASLGDFMPPTALAAIFAAQVVGIEKYSRVLKRLWLPALIIIAWGLLFIEFSKQVRGIY